MTSEFSDDDTLDAGAETHNPQLSALPCDAYHHFYHYQASAQYLWLAETLRALEKRDEAQTAYGKAVFQDHQNAEAIERKKFAEAKAIAPKYDKHPLSDLAFCASVGELPGDATRLHDEALCAVNNGDMVGAFTALGKAIALEPSHSNSYFARGRLWFAQDAYAKALADFGEAVRLSHLRHDAYHRFASGEHLARGLVFLTAGEADLAIADFSKALDLHGKNKAARMARAKTYRAKGSVKLAEEDERITLLL